MMEAVERVAPEAAVAVGVDLEDIKAAAAKIARIVAEGPGAVGVRAKKLDITGDFTVEEVEARSGAERSKKV
jgi:tRNA(Ser,Leu) C12 N-acetylase TAN1